MSLLSDETSHCLERTSKPGEGGGILILLELIIKNGLLRSFTSSEIVHFLFSLLNVSGCDNVNSGETSVQNLFCFVFSGSVYT